VGAKYLVEGSELEGARRIVFTPIPAIRDLASLFTIVYRCGLNTIFNNALDLYGSDFDSLYEDAKAYIKEYGMPRSVFKVGGATPSLCAIIVPSDLAYELSVLSRKLMIQYYDYKIIESSAKVCIMGAALLRYYRTKVNDPAFRRLERWFPKTDGVGAGTVKEA
jgi:hypothetical protein